VSHVSVYIACMSFIQAAGINHFIEGLARTNSSLVSLAIRSTSLSAEHLAYVNLLIIYYLFIIDTHIDDHLCCYYY
jgi:hypothetical protein